MRTTTLERLDVWMDQSQVFDALERLGDRISPLRSPGSDHAAARWLENVGRLTAQPSGPPTELGAPVGRVAARSQRAPSGSERLRRSRVSEAEASSPGPGRDIAVVPPALPRPPVGADPARVRAAALPLSDGSLAAEREAALRKSLSQHTKQGACHDPVWSCKRPGC